jgi:hypothetical protein
MALDRGTVLHFAQHVVACGHEGHHPQTQHCPVIYQRRRALELTAGNRPAHLERAALAAREMQSSQRRPHRPVVALLIGLALRIDLRR